MTIIKDRLSPDTLPRLLVEKDIDSKKYQKGAARRVARLLAQQKNEPRIIDYIDLPKLEDSYRYTQAADFGFMLNRRKLKPEDECWHDFMGPGKGTVSGTYRCTKCGLTLYVSVIGKPTASEDNKQMCTVDEERIIKMTVEEMLQQGQMFTSVDVGNKIKLSGTWISNHEVATYLRDNVLWISQNLMILYKQTPIPVTIEDGSTRQASLYHPVGSNPDDYRERSQKALNPIEANHPKAASLHIQSVPPVVAAPAPQPTPDPDPGIDISPWRITSV